MADVHLREQLTSFIRWKIDRPVITHEPRVAWPAELQPFATCFEGYCWASAFSLDKPRMFGIAPAGHRPPHHLSDLEPAIFRPRDYLYAQPRTSKDDLDYYLIVELFNPEFACADLAMFVRGGSWHILDQHIVRMPPPNLTRFD